MRRDNWFGWDLGRIKVSFRLAFKSALWGALSYNKNKGYKEIEIE